jgi:omega-hydroxy-beta-dihydromenaquinone-9 sulfotransferase
MRFYLNGIAECWKMFGANRHFLHCTMVILMFTVLSVIKTVTLFFDRIFFPKFKDVEVRQPVFIIGHPRSGTTFIHKLFTQTDEMAAYYSWHLLFPSITARIVVRPIIDFFKRRGLTTLIPEETGHGVALDKVEEEELLFLHNSDTQFAVILSPLGFLEDEFPQYRFHDQMPDAHRIRSARFLKSLFQRHIYYTGKQQIFAQTHFSTHRIKTLMEVFPDARFIYMHRMPEETLPSAFSLIENMIDLLWGMHRFSEQQARQFFQYRYQASIDLYKYFYDVWQNNEIDRKRVMIVPYEQLKSDLKGVFERVVEFTHIEPSDDLKKAVSEQAEKQKKYQRIHEVRALEEFGIDSQRLKKDFAFLYGNDPFPADF